jgi:hypothetical protein
MIDRYQRLLDLTLEQRALIEAGDWAGAAGIGVAWQGLVEGLPERAPEYARALLDEAASIAWSNTAAIEALSVEVSRELEHLGRGRLALSSYATPDSTSLDARV